MTINERIVTLHARVWIEIATTTAAPGMRNGSPSTRGCGLKLAGNRNVAQAAKVTLHARVWIEMTSGAQLQIGSDGHPPREGVD